MKRIILFILFLCMAGCATVNIPNYIDPQHPYVRKVYGDYNAIIATVRQVLADEGWAVQSETSPSTYERDGSTQSSATGGILLFTSVKQHSKFLYSSYTHLNAFIRPMADGAEVEMRYACLTPLGVKQLKGTRNDKLVNRILDAIEHRSENIPVP
jgi:hypothetical protein